MFVSKTGVVGTGAAAAALAELIAAAGLAVVVSDGDLAGFGDVDFVIEALPEDADRKLAAFAALDAATPGRAILASATETVGLDELAAATMRPDRVLGFHLNRMARPLLEIVEAADTSPQALATAVSLAAALRTPAIRCLVAPGLVVNRVLCAAAPERIDPVIAAHLREVYGERFQDEPPSADAAELEERFALKALVESCLLIEEGVTTTRELDLALRAGAGLDPPPLAGADARGLDVVVERLERAAAEWGERYSPPAILRRLAQGGRGVFPAPRPDGGQRGPVKLESRGEVAIAWLDKPPANSLTLEVLDALSNVWRAVSADDGVRALIIASANPSLFCAGADIKEFATMDAAAEEELIGGMHALLLEIGRSRIVTIAAVNGLAYGGGCELAMGADIRLAARSASFAQPEIKLGLVPGLGGTQRLPRLIGAGRALEMNLTGEPVDAFEAWEIGLVNRVVDDHELLDEALAWARSLAAAPPLAVEEIKRLTSHASLEAGIETEKAAFARVFASADAREGIAAFVEKRPARFGGI